MKTGHDYRGKRTRSLRVGPPASPWPGRITETRQGIERKPREGTAASLPPNERHLQVLAVLGPNFVSMARIAADAGLPYAGTQSALYALQARGLAERLPNKGWKKVERPDDV